MHTFASYGMAIPLIILLSSHSFSFLTTLSSPLKRPKPTNQQREQN